jgi:hypothetical protein
MASSLTRLCAGRGIELRMRSSPVPLLLFLASCGSADHSSGASGLAEISYVDAHNVSTAIDAPIAKGASQIVRVRLRRFDLDAVVFATNNGNIALRDASHAGAGVWYVTLTGLADGKSTLTIGDGAGKTLDTFDFEVATIKSFEVPASVDVNVGGNAVIDAIPKDQSGRVLHAGNFVHWSVDHPEAATFWENLGNRPLASTTGTRVQIHGVGAGKATAHGVFDENRLDVAINVH